MADCSLQMALAVWVLCVAFFHKSHPALAHLTSRILLGRWAHCLVVLPEFVSLCRHLFSAQLEFL